MVREINQALRKRIPPSWVNLTTNSFGYIWLKSEKCPKITNSYIKSNIFAQSSLVIGPNMIWKSQTKPKTNILLTPLLNAFWKYSVQRPTWGRWLPWWQLGGDSLLCNTSMCSLTIYPRIYSIFFNSCQPCKLLTFRSATCQNCIQGSWPRLLPSWGVSALEELNSSLHRSTYSWQNSRRNRTK